MFSLTALIWVTLLIVASVLSRFPCWVPMRYKYVPKYALLFIDRWTDVRFLSL